MSYFTTTLIEWGGTLLSLYGSWLCIRHRASGFVVFLIADAAWFASAWLSGHRSLLAQQTVYILLNIVGYVLWRRDERLRWRPSLIQANGDFDTFPHRHHANVHLHRAGALGLAAA